MEKNKQKKKVVPKSALVIHEVIENKIFLIRGKKVMLDRDLAELYEVKPIRLREQVKRNKKRFPEDFMFQLNKSETAELIANCDRFKTIKHSAFNPYVFTEQGVAMLSTVLNSERAIHVNIAIMRTFVKLREMVSTNKELAHRLNLLEKRMETKDKEIRLIFEAVRQLINEPESVPEKPKRKMGFHT